GLGGGSGDSADQPLLLWPDRRGRRTRGGVLSRADAKDEALPEQSFFRIRNLSGGAWRRIPQRAGPILQGPSRVLQRAVPRRRILFVGGEGERRLRAAALQ